MPVSIMTIAIVAAISVTASTAGAESAQDFAYRHFNESAEGAGDRRIAPTAPAMRVTVSLRGRSALDVAVRRHNADASHASDRIRTTRLSVAPSVPTHGADIFAEMREESRENE